MKFYLIIVLVHTVCIAANSESGTKVEVNPRKIAEDGQYPFQVSIRSKVEDCLGCGGALLNNRFILTTAYCVYAKKPERIYAILGIFRQNDDGLRVNIENIKEHESYKYYSEENNLALLRIVEEINFSHRIQPVQMPPSYWSDSNYGDFEVSGWVNLEMEYKLQYQDAILKQCYMSASDPSTNSSHFFCVETLSFYPRPGSLLTFRESYLVGISSQPHNWNADAYTRISTFLPWIEESLEPKGKSLVKMVLIVGFSGTALIVVVLLLIKYVKRVNGRRRPEPSTTTTLATTTSIPIVSSISYNAPEHNVPSAPPSTLYLTTPSSVSPPSYDHLFPNKPEFSSHPYNQRPV